MLGTKVNYSLTLLIIGISFILFMVILTWFNKRRMDKEEEKEIELSLLNEEIEKRHRVISEMDEHITNRTIDRTSSLARVEIDVLDLYDKANIRIPADILEDLSIQRLSTHQEVFDYIENQRNYWKLENSKKPYKGAIAK